MNNRTVLLLEEEAITALDVEHTLADAAVGEVVAFARRAEALSWLSAHTPDLAIIDVSLWDGACDDVAELLADRQVPFVVHSAWNCEFGTRNPVFRNSLWVAKPSRPVHLLTAVRECMDRIPA